MNDAIVRRRLWIVLMIYEATVITIMAWTGLQVALMGGGSAAMASPLLLIAAAESLRIPLAGWATRLTLAGKALSAVALVTIAVGSAEALAVSFEMMLNNRAVDALRAASAVEAANLERATLTAEIAELDKQTVEPAPPAPIASNRTCSWRGQRVSCSADAVAMSAWRDTLRERDNRLADLARQRKAVQGKIDAIAIDDAKAKFAALAEQNPVFRLTAAIYGEDVSAVTAAQFATVKKYAVAGLAIAFATLSMAVSVIAHLTPRSAKQPGKLSRALRAMFAARRKTLRRVRETVRTEYRDRTTFIHVPVDVATGRVIDPDGTLGQPAGGSRP
jgi:hypothetical protein